MRRFLFVLLFVIAGSAWAKPPIIVTKITSQCLKGVPTITVTLDAVTWGSWNGYLYYHLNPPSPGIAWPANTNPATFPVPSTPVAGSLQITSSASPTGGTPSAVYHYTVATCGGSASKKGMTWVHSLSNAQTGTITVGCGPASNPCDAYHGDTLCTQQLPVLCIYKPAPPFPVPVGVNNSDQYNLWSGGVVATTAPIAGNTFQHLSANPPNDANSYCVAQFGPGWRVAEFHDGWGWHFQAYGGTVSAPAVPSTRFWVNINDQPANCWANP